MQKKEDYWKVVQKVIKNSDIILEVVDARFPKDSRNHKVEDLVKKLGKKLVIVMNKADLVPESFLKKVVRKFSREYPTVYLSAQKRHGTRNLFKLINKLRAGKSVKIGVVGYPNVGKSMIINILKGKHSAYVSPIPGYTKGIQYIRIAKGILLIDTPGVAPIKGKRGLAVKCAVDINKVSDPIELVKELLKILSEKNKKAFKELYKIDIKDPDSFVKKVAEKYNFKIKGGILDLRRAAIKIYNDWLKGKLKIYWL